MIALIPPRISLLSLCAALLVFVDLRLVLAADTCYNKDGVQVNSLPCDPTAAAGPCCSLGWICLSNGLCSPGPNVTNNGFVDYYRPDGCTDPTWNTEACFSGCNKCTERPTV
ncbi:hypothetical protein K505DRAFT_76750 [Melanomma pulvis-pyrius CBS 109.77]|uniref:Uncharacterized protein n=1 Tax=Melanomma pulvis-pyrius CBS 109.77 TaxID=1314802 RepID=A0A6A6X436_9PLEO|nr:hypothetical protein K505DRAFT_76750 [Melanomma pulvis-pyrius CBS 109.77]